MGREVINWHHIPIPLFLYHVGIMIASYCFKLVFGDLFSKSDSLVLQSPFVTEHTQVSRQLLIDVRKGRERMGKMKSECDMIH